MKKLLYYSAILAVALSTTGCVKELLSGVGSEVQFSANTYYDNGPATKTAYSGVTSNGKERINWINGDRVRIYSPQAEHRSSSNQHWADYDIDANNINPNNEKSTARVKNTGNNGLVWGTGSHTFYGVYPSPSAFSGVTMSNNVVTATLPKTQAPSVIDDTTNGQVFFPNMNWAYMYAAKSGVSAGSTVDLPFKPLMTAFEITLGTQNTNGITVKDIYLFTDNSGSNLTGTFTATIQADNTISVGSTISNPSHELHVGLPTNTVSIQNGKSITFTLFALPIPITHLGLTVVFQDNTTKTLAFKDNVGDWIPFDACKKYRITNINTPQGWDYTIDIDEVSSNLVAYGHEAVTSGLNFKVISTKTNGSSTSSVGWTAEIISAEYAQTNQLTLGALSGGNDANVTATISGTTPVGEATGYDSSEATRAALAAATPRGTVSVPFDLSRHPVYGDIDGTSYNPTTANCYVISAPGVYKFPLVYGNALVNGTENTKAFKPTAAGITYSGGYYLPTFLNVNNSPIQYPYILKDLGLNPASCNAAIVWQDAQDILRDTQCSVGGTSGEDAYIQFEIKKEDIQAGNIVLALRNSSNKILWSWHIWVTEKNLTPSQVGIVSGSQGPSTTMIMGYNLGWTDAQTAWTKSWYTRKFVVRLTQAESGLTKDLTIKQIGDVISVENNVGSNTFYQWGRKDPMRPAASSNAFKTLYFGQGYSTTITYTEDPNTHEIVQSIAPTIVPSSGTVTVGHAIQNPHLEYKNTSTSGWLGGPATSSNTEISGRPGNLWNANVSVMSSGAASSKTVYDPCPPGFCVMRSSTFYAISGVTSANPWPQNPACYNSNGYFIRRNDGVQFDNSYGKVFLPFTGAIGMEAGNIYDVKALGYYWTDSVTGESNYQRAKYTHLQIIDDSSTLVRPHHEQYRGACYAVRPVLETASPSSGTSGLPQSSRLPAPAGVAELGW